MQSGKFLGEVIGKQAGVESFVTSKVCEWSRYVELLSSIAVDQPQVTYMALTKSLQSGWIFLQRVTSNCSELFGAVEQALTNRFIPSLMGHDCNTHERLLYSLPVRMGGLNIKNPVTTADSAYSASRSAVHLLVDSIKSQTAFSPVDHYTCVQQSKQEQNAIQKDNNDRVFSSIIGTFDDKHQRAIIRSNDSLSS